MGRTSSSRRLDWALGACAILAAAAPLRAQFPPLHDEVLVNTYTTDLQDLPRLSAAGDGRFVVVWSGALEDGSDFGVFGQRFDRHGTRTGPEFLVNTYTTGFQALADVAMDPTGRFVVVWNSGQEESQYGVYGQRFDASGIKAGSEFRVNTYTTSYQQLPKVAIADSGDFVVVWESYGQDGSRWGVFGQRYDSAGVKLGTEFQVNTVTFGDQLDPSVGGDGSGRFVVVWKSSDFDDFGIFGQRFDASGAKVGSEFQVNELTAGKQEFPAIAVDRKGNFVVAWQGPPGPGTFETDVRARRFNAAAERVGEEFTVNDADFGKASNAALAMDRAGNFVVTWQYPGAFHSISAQRFDRGGARVGESFDIPLLPPASALSIGDGGGGLAAAWRASDGSSDGVKSRREDFQPEALAVDARTTANTSSDGNGVFEPGENPLIEPTWSNRTGSDLVGLAGSAQKLTGPPGASYFLPDDHASYGTVAPDASASCNDGTPDSCYIALIFTLGARPVMHWDAHLNESTGHLWTLHLGDSFDDVPRSQPFYRKIETLLHHKITTGCGNTQYCPDSVVSRDAMAIFVAKGIAGLAELVPSSGKVGTSAYSCKAGGHSLFTDVAPTDSFCKHVHYLAAQNVTVGCFGTNYCPGATITRDAMASFIAKAIVAPKGAAAVPATYTDPTTSRSYSCVAGSANIHFTDVPVSNAFCKHIHFLWAKGIVEGCSPTTYCPGAPVARDAMAKFIANGFGLRLYGP